MMLHLAFCETKIKQHSKRSHQLVQDCVLPVKLWHDRIFLVLTPDYSSVDRSLLLCWSWV